jgi:hypothetical protein
LAAIVAKAAFSGSTAGTLAPQHKGLIAGGAFSLSLLGDALMTYVHKGKA